MSKQISKLLVSLFATTTNELNNNTFIKEELLHCWLLSEQFLICCYNWTLHFQKPLLLTAKRLSSKRLSSMQKRQYTLFYYKNHAVNSELRLAVLNFLWIFSFNCS